VAARPPEAGEGTPAGQGIEPRGGADAVLRRVELQIGRRLDGILQGERRGRRPGPGGEPTLTRAYEPGDDVRWVDWPLSARAGVTMVRVPEIEPVLTAWALVDLSPSMGFGSRVETKAELAREVLAGIGVILRRRGDRLGVVASRRGELDLVLPPRGDRRGLVASLAALDRAAPPALAPEPRAGAPVGRTDLARALRGLGRVARHRGAVVVLSDLPGSADPGTATELERAFGLLARNHEVVAVEIRDRRERELPVVGPLTLRDVETGRRALVDTADPRFRRRFAEVVAEASQRRAALLARAGAHHVVLETGDDWVPVLAAALRRPLRRRSRVGIAGPPGP
jgi:uncharacterized protein (DUF58 family)